MPDYNPAVATGIAPQGNALSGTFDTIMNLQRTQAQTGLIQLQQLQQAREYNALQAASQAGIHGESRSEAYMRNGGQNPSLISEFQNYDSNARFAAGHGGLLPQGAEATANIALRGAETAKVGVETQNAGLQTAGIAAESDTKVRAGAAQVANQFIADPSSETRQAMIEYTRKYQGSLAAAQLERMSNDELMARAKGHVGGGLTAEQGAATVETQNPQGAPVYQTRAQFLAGQPGSGGPVVGQSAAAKKFQEGGATENIADLKAANEKYATAGEVQGGLLNIQNNLDKLPVGGFWTSGKGAADRLALAKTVNTAVQSVGGNPVFDPTKVAAGEAAQKGTVKLGFDLAKTLGTREAAMIVQQSIGVQPGIEMTPEGNHRIMTSLMVAAQRDKDYTQFLHDALSQNPNMLPGQAAIAFNQAHPPSEYVNRVNQILNIPKAKVDLLRANPDKAPDFDAKYGNGDNISRFLLAR